MKRGEVWTAAAGRTYTAKPRPVVIVQDDRFDASDSVTVAPITSDSTAIPLFRIELAPSSTNGLRVSSRVMADKVTTVPRRKLGRQIGSLDAEEMKRVDAALTVFLGLAG